MERVEGMLTKEQFEAFLKGDRKLVKTLVKLADIKVENSIAEEQMSQKMSPTGKDTHRNG